MMTEPEILKKAVEKARKNGWKSVYGEVIYAFSPNEAFITNEEHLKFIFSHEFAKAFWGNGQEEHDIGNGLTLWEGSKGAFFIEGPNAGKILPYWKTQLQQMVLEEKPLEYLERYL